MDQTADDRFIMDDPSIVLRISGRWCGIPKLSKITAAANVFERSVPSEFFCENYGVDRTSRIVNLLDCSEYFLMGVEIKFLLWRI